jgi:phosphate:Na+ symporter
MTKAELINSIASKVDCTKKEADTALNAVIGAITEALEKGDRELAKNVKRSEKALSIMEAELRTKHLERLNNKQCSPEFTVMYTDVVHNIERIGDSCDNIANAVLDDIKIKLTGEEVLEI